MSALLVGDVRDRIREIPDHTVELVCTSPPFLALRKYGDNDAEMGSEANPAAFIDALLELTAEFRRVLTPHGSIAIELGDTYSGSGGAGGDYNENGLREGQATFDGSGLRARGGRTVRAADVANGLQHDRGRPGPEGRDRMPGWPLAKSLAGIPHAYMLSLAYGFNVLDRHGPDSPAGRWRVRNMIVWARPNPPVGALGDKVRPATSYITVACTSGRRWFDLDAVRSEPNARTDTDPGGYVPFSPKRGTKEYAPRTMNPAGAPPLDWCEDNDPTGHATLVLPTAPYPGAHYATWPPALAQRLIEMMAPLRVCQTCGEPSRRIVGDAEYERTDTDKVPARLTMTDGMRPAAGVNQHLRVDGANTSVIRNAPTLGWTDCGHNNWRRGHVLDPFAGSGTTLAVAEGCGRDATGIELYKKNADLIADRCGMFLALSPNDGKEAL